MLPCPCESEGATPFLGIPKFALQNLAAVPRPQHIYSVSRGIPRNQSYLERWSEDPWAHTEAMVGSLTSFFSFQDKQEDVAHACSCDESALEILDAKSICKLILPPGPGMLRSSTTSLPQVTSRRLQNAKSDKFHENVLKRGQVSAESEKSVSVQHGPSTATRSVHPSVKGQC